MTDGLFNTGCGAHGLRTEHRQIFSGHPRNQITESDIEIHSDFKITDRRKKDLLLGQ